MRPTRDGGSPSSARALGAIKNNRPDKHISRTALLFPAKVAFMFVSPISDRIPEDWPVGASVLWTRPNAPIVCNPPEIIKLQASFATWGTLFVESKTRDVASKWPEFNNLQQ